MKTESHFRGDPAGLFELNGSVDVVTASADGNGDAPWRFVLS